MKIYFNHTAIQAHKFKRQILKSVSQIIKSGIYLNGQENIKLQNNLSNYLGRGYITNIASGHEALMFALSALQLSYNDEVIFPVNAYPTAFPVFMSKAKPVPVDVDENGQLDPVALSKKLSKKTRAVIVVYLYGLIGKLDKIMDVIKSKSIFLIEDCAQAFGSQYKGKPVGTFGDISCFSFYPTKNLGTLGDGGALWTRHKRFHSFFLSAKKYGEKKKYHSHFLSGHSRLPEIQAGILNVYFNELAKDFNKRKKLMHLYYELLNNKKISQYIKLLISRDNSDPVIHLFVIEVKKRKELMRHLSKNGIETAIHYPYPIHKVPAFASYFDKKETFVTAERLSNNIISLPFHQYMTGKQIKYIADKIKEFYTLYAKNKKS